METHGVIGVIDGFDLVLATAEPARAASFYRDVLGGSELADAARWQAERAVALGDQVVAFRVAREEARSSPKGIYDAVGLRVVAVFVSDIDAVCARIEASGRRVAQGVDLPGKLSVRFARDSDGNTLELIGLGGAVPPHPIQVGLTARDAAVSTAFFAEQMGWRAQPSALIQKGITRHGFDVGPATLKLWQPLGDPVDLRGPTTGEIGIAAVVLRTRDTKGEGLPFEDPDGNRFEWVVA